MREPEKLCEKMVNAIAAAAVGRPWDLLQLWLKEILAFNPGVCPAKYWQHWGFWSLNVLSVLLFIYVNFFFHYGFFQGTLIQHLKEHILHGNMTSNDIIMYYTTASVAY